MSAKYCQLKGRVSSQCGTDNGKAFYSCSCFCPHLILSSPEKRSKMHLKVSGWQPLLIIKENQTWKVCMNGGANSLDFFFFATTCRKLIMAFVYENCMQCCIIFLMLRKSKTWNILLTEQHHYSVSWNLHIKQWLHWWWGNMNLVVLGGVQNW